MLGLPLNDCEVIRQNQDLLFNWYQGCVDIFAGEFDSGVGALAELLNFLSKLSICAKHSKFTFEIKMEKKQKKSRKRSGTGPLLQSQAQEEDAAYQKECISTFFKKWVLGEDVQAVAEAFQRLKARAIFDDYREIMLERELPWGLTAISRFLNVLAQERHIHLAKNLDFLPSLVKYGVPQEVACFLTKWRIPRESATRIANHFAQQFGWNEDSEADSSVVSTSEQAKRAVCCLTGEDIDSLKLNESEVRRINELKSRFLEENRRA